MCSFANGGIFSLLFDLFGVRGLNRAGLDLDGSVSSKNAKSFGAFRVASFNSPSGCLFSGLWNSRVGEIAEIRNGELARGL